MRTLILTSLLLALALPSQAYADESYVYANESRASDGLLYEAVRKADEFWRSKGYEPRCVRIYLLTEPAVLARASLVGDKVWFERSYVRRIRRQIASRDRDLRRWAYENLFVTAAHERGHNLGYKHEDGGIMGEAPKIPGIGLDWAKEKAR